MTILKKLSNVLKEVFWIKPSRSPKKPAKRFPRKSKAEKVKKSSKAKDLKPKQTSKILKASKVVRPKVKQLQLDPHLIKTGEITHYFDRIKVCVVKITQGTVLIGDKLTIAGEKYKFVQKVWSMQVESQDVKVAKKGQLIGLKVDKLVNVGDIVYK